MPTASQPSVNALESRRGLFAVLGAFTIWGLLPLYLHALQPIAPLLLVTYRLVLCCIVTLGWLALRGEAASVWTALRNPSSRRRLFLTALLINVNWVMYVWAVANGRVVEASLGYFINPLVNVLLGVVWLRERLRMPQWAAVSLAAAGVAYLTLQTGAVPVVSLVLALSFSLYGLLRKLLDVEAMTGLAAETSLAMPLGAAYLLWTEFHGAGAFSHPNARSLVPLLAVSGVITAIPLWLFSYGTRRIPYATVGLAQYLSPSLQLLCGLHLFHESFDTERMVGFGLIWAGLAVYSLDALRMRGR